MARILIVDDDPALLRLLSLRLREEGHEPIEAPSGEAALARLDQALPQLVITDLRMGGMDGLQLFDAVHRRHPLLPVLILTAHGTIPDAVRALRQGVFGYLPKPFEAHELMQEVGRALAASQALGADIPGDEPGDSWREAILTRSPRMEQVLAEARLVAGSEASVVIQGPSGSGKELLARALHAASPRSRHPLVAVNCGAIPENLVESELFGHVKGAFTGAVRDRPGLFVEARGGTLFLDEVAELPLPAQVKLLRVLQEREVRAVGAERPVRVDVRVVSASHRRLQDEVAAGRFREDLFYRLHVVGLELPALSQRREDIPLLAQHFLASLAQRYAKRTTGFAPGALELLVSAAWPGNVRQLQNVVEKCVVLGTTPLVPAPLVQRALANEATDMQPLDNARRQFERDYLVQLLKMTSGNVSQAARLARRNRTDFYALLGRHQLEPGAFKPGS
ncbi:sigma 54-interacting transcriptional regulator [Ramlibacter pallidus]|uniref:Sigma 54-interacting transcriptional regulator n=1 Tax=Ramlibacter pallidus TaxID=2780087 RepID=A0ABR9S2E8_9BURK|nr:sigma 54-interacting transcriptional regulator [Ramlibacter pallidus]MBE7367619.1 sigma 54-interacting transcriptional regulator [Ramlibacter pallidus]